MLVELYSLFLVLTSKKTNNYNEKYEKKGVEKLRSYSFF